jgi:flavin-dependent dehydrogenase
MTSTDPLHGVRILISGAGVAGPALAHWLSRYGADTTVVEVARREPGPVPGATHRRPAADPERHVQDPAGPAVASRQHTIAGDDVALPEYPRWGAVNDPHPT